MIDDIVDYFVPERVSIKGRANHELARIFVFTHLFGPVIASPMGIYLIAVSPEITASLVIVIASIMSFMVLPFVLKRTGRLKLCAVFSFQGLTTASLYGTFFYGGVSSPFLPWLIVSLLLGFFYLSKKITLVLSLFGTSLAVFLGFVVTFGFADVIPTDELRPMGWLSIVAATAYMTWMALYYSRMIAMRDAMEVESQRYLETLRELETARLTAETMNRSKAQFFSKMSHELRTPLNAIIGYSDLLMEDAEERDDKNEQNIRDIGRINAAGKHLLSLFSEVLDMSSLERDANRMDVATFGLRGMCDEVVASVNPMVEAGGNTLVIDCEDATVHTDERKMRQIIINLLSNASKFTKNGTIKVSLQRMAGEGGERLVVKVTDTGIGIAKDTLPKLFESYEQADETIAKRFGGTGLGLSLCRKFAVMLAGEIDVTSKFGKGSTFTVNVAAVLDTKEKEAAPSDRDVEWSGDTTMGLA